MAARMRRRLAALVCTAATKWRCAECDTWNDERDVQCHCCGS